MAVAVAAAAAVATAAVAIATKVASAHIEGGRVLLPPFLFRQSPLERQAEGRPEAVPTV